MKIFTGELSAALKADCAFLVGVRVGKIDAIESPATMLPMITIEEQSDVPTLQADRIVMERRFTGLVKLYIKKGDTFESKINQIETTLKKFGTRGVRVTPGANYDRDFDSMTITVVFDYNTGELG